MSLFTRVLQVADVVDRELVKGAPPGLPSGTAVAGYIQREPLPVPANAMRVAPGTDAVVWRICPDHSGEL